jgi:hypothetical protein
MEVRANWASAELWWLAAGGAGFALMWSLLESAGR